MDTLGKERFCLKIFTYYIMQQEQRQKFSGFTQTTQEWKKSKLEATQTLKTLCLNSLVKERVGMGKDREEIKHRNWKMRMHLVIINYNLQHHHSLEDRHQVHLQGSFPFFCFIFIKFSASLFSFFWDRVYCVFLAGLELAW